MRKNILFVINTLSRAGAETALLELLPRFSDPDLQVDLFVLLGQGELISRVPDGVRLLNRHFSKETVLSAKGRLHLVATVLKSMLRRATVFRRFPYLCSNLFRMLKAGRLQKDKLLWRVVADGAPRFSKEYDLAVSYIEGGSAYYVADHVKAKKKAVFIHIDYPMSGYDRKLDLDAYLKYDKVFAVSEHTKESFLESYPELSGKAFVFHNIVNQASIREKALLPGGFSDAFDGVRILTVARLTKQKALSVSVEAMKLLKDQGCRARWYVLGEGDERKALEQRIRELSLEDSFFLLGAVENPYPYFKQTTLYVHATAFEGKSIAIQEAQTLGCPIIVSDIDSNRQQVEEGVDGLLTELSPEAIAAAIAGLINDPQKAKMLGENAAKRLASNEEDIKELMNLL